MARSLTSRSTNPKIMDDNIKILDDAIAAASTPPAEDVSYDNTDSGLAADDVQAAIDEVLDMLPGKIAIETFFGVTWTNSMAEITPAHTPIQTATLRPFFIMRTGGPDNAAYYPIAITYNSETEKFNVKMSAESNSGANAFTILYLYE